MRYVDEIIRAVEQHPSISLVHKRVLIDRIEKTPTGDEIARAKVALEEEGAL